MTSSAVIIGALGLAAGALLVWLPVRILNRSWTDRKARLGFGLLVALMSYPALMGPLCWLSSRLNFGTDAVTFIYHPVIELKLDGRCPLPVWEVVRWYSEIGADSSWHWILYIHGKGLLPGYHVPERPKVRFYWGEARPTLNEQAPMNGMDIPRRGSIGQKSSIS